MFSYSALSFIFPGKEVNLVASKTEPKDKYALTIEEAASYFGIGETKLRELTMEDNCPFVLWNGSKRLIKRVLLERYLDKAFSI